MTHPDKAGSKGTMKKKTTVKEAFDKSLSEGWVMMKEVSPAVHNYGLFNSSYTPAQYDMIVAVDRKSLLEGFKNGYVIDSDKMNTGDTALSILLEVGDSNEQN